MKAYSRFHMATLYDMFHKGPQPARKADVKRLVDSGLIVAGKRGQFGQTVYSLTDSGKAFAKRIRLADRIYSID